VSSSVYDSLYPGALFEGIQTNKTKEHRVSVRIVDINLQQSTLSGFLTIHDLTDQHPEITTFFDGQIIGDTYGFVTNDWGASEDVDMIHW
jgi:glucose-induced degradation protein 4